MGFPLSYVDHHSSSDIPISVKFLTTLSLIFTLLGSSSSLTSENASSHFFVVKEYLKKDVCIVLVNLLNV